MLQREIDARRRAAGAPEAALVVIAGMLCAHLEFLGEELANLYEDLREADCLMATAGK